jgi:hypothetical protein
MIELEFAQEFHFGKPSSNTKIMLVTLKLKKNSNDSSSSKHYSHKLGSFTPLNLSKFKI